MVKPGPLSPAATHSTVHNSTSPPSSRLLGDVHVSLMLTFMRSGSGSTGLSDSPSKDSFTIFKEFLRLPESFLRICIVFINIYPVRN